MVAFAVEDAPFGLGKLLSTPKRGLWTVQWYGNEEEDPEGRQLPCWTWTWYNGFYCGVRKETDDIPFTCKIKRQDIRVAGILLERNLKVSKQLINECFPPDMV